MKLIEPTLFFLALLAILAYAMQKDYQTYKMEQSFYCEMVEAGHWPPYKGECKDGE